MEPIKTLTANILGKSKMLFLLALILPTAPRAQSSIECQIMRQRIMELVNAPNQCQSNYQQCLVNARYAPNYQMAQSQCQIQLGGCQMGNALGAMVAPDQINQAIQEYKFKCER